MVGKLSADHAGRDSLRAAACQVAPLVCRCRVLGVTVLPSATLSPQTLLQCQSRLHVARLITRRTDGKPKLLRLPPAPLTANGSHVSCDPYQRGNLQEE